MAKKLIYNYTFTPGPSNQGTIEITGNYPTKTWQIVTDTGTGGLYPHIFVRDAYSSTTGGIEIITGGSGNLTIAVNGTTFDENTGVMTVTTTASHGLVTGNTIKFREKAAVFTCAKDKYLTEHPYPRTTDPIYDTAVAITVLDNDTFTVATGRAGNVGKISSNNEIIYNFSQAAKGGSAFYDSLTDTTKLTLRHDTSHLDRLDELQIFVDIQEQKLDFSETFTDPVNKLRVSTPQNLIDTDFEYGLQPAKWETVELVNNVPTFYPSSDYSIKDVARVETLIGATTITVTTINPHSLTAGSPIDIQGLLSRTAEGKYLIDTIIDDYKFTYIASKPQNSTSTINASYTVITPGQFYTGSKIKFNSSEGIETDDSLPSSLTIKTDYTHGFEAGSNLYITNTVGKVSRIFDPSDRSANAPDGSPFLDTRSNLNEDKEVLMNLSSTNAMTGTYTKKITSSTEIITTTNAIGWSSHGLQAGDCLFYYCPRGNTPITGLMNYRVYMVKTVIDANSFTLALSNSDLTPTGITINLESGATFEAGAHQFMLCYKIQYIRNTGNQLRMYTANNSVAGRGSLSGRDRVGTDGNLGLPGKNPERWMFLTNNTNLPTQYAESWFDTFTWHHPSSNVNFTYGTPANPNGPESGYDFIEDFTRWDGLSSAYTTGNSSLVSSISLIYNYENAIQIRWNDYSNRTNQFFPQNNSGAAEELYWLPLQADTSGETLYVGQHGLAINSNFTVGMSSINTTGGKSLQFLLDNNGNSNALPSFVGIDTTFSLRVSSINENELKLIGYIDSSGTEISAGISSLPAGISLSYGRSNPLKNTFYIPEHKFDSGERLTISLPGSGSYPDTPPPGIADFDHTSTDAVNLVFNSVTDALDTVKSGKNYLSDSRLRFNTSNYGTERSIVYGPNAVIDGAIQNARIILYNHYVRTYNGTNILINHSTDSSVYNGELNLGGVVDIGKNLPSLVNKGFYKRQTKFEQAGYTPYWVSVIQQPAASNFTGADNVWVDHNLLILFDRGNVIATTNNTQFTNFTNDQVWTSYNGFSYKYESKIVHPDNGYHGGWAIEMWLSSPSFSGYHTSPLYDTRDNSYFWTNNSNDVRNEFLSLNTRYPNTVGKQFKITVIIPIKTGYTGGSTNDYGPAGTSLNSQQICEEIINELSSRLANIAIGSGPVFANPVNGNRTGLENAFGQSYVFTGIGTNGPIQLETEEKPGVLDGAYQVDFVDDNTIKMFTKSRFPKRVISIGSSDIVDNDGVKINYSGHNLFNGQKVVYEASSGDSIDNVFSGATYNVVVKGPNYFELASTELEALSGNTIGIGTTSAGSFTFTTSSISARVPATGTVSLTEGDTKVTGTNTAFKRFLKVGDNFTVNDTTQNPSTYVTYTVASVIADDEMTIMSPSDFTSVTSKYYVETGVSARPNGLSAHRPFDGGVEITAGSSPNSSIVRQTRKYFRYQSGKGIQCSVAINFNPSRQINTLVSTANTTLSTKNYDINVNNSGNGTYNLSGDDRDGSLFGQNSTISIMKGDTLNLNLNNLVGHPVWIKTDRSTGIGNSVTTGISNNGGTSGTLIWNTTNVGVGTYYYNCQNHSSMSGIINVEAVPAAGTVVTGITRYPHGLTRNDSITVKGASEVGYNGTFDIKASDDFTFNYFVTGTPNSTTSGIIDYNIGGWENSFVRCGLFDYQNGMFFEYDGQELYAVRRSSIRQLTGTISCLTDSNIINGLETKFIGQLNDGDFVVIRGGSYRITKVVSNTELHIQPSYRGINSDAVIITKTEDVRVPQSSWNIDKADGTGPSGFVLDITKIQMAYIDYSWYGAGKIRFGFKDAKGHVKYMHEFIHNNKLQEAYMRSGNIPARYEIENKGSSIPTYVPSLFHWGTSVIMDGTFDDDKAYLFTANADTLLFTNGDSSSATTNANSISTRTYNRPTRQYQWYNRLRFSAADQSKFATGTKLYTSTGSLSGQSVSYTQRSGSNVFVYVSVGSNYDFSNPPAEFSVIPSGTSVSAGAAAGGDQISLQDPVPLISIRLAPSVDNNLTGALGERDIVNRMQLQLKQLGITLSHDCEVSLILNGDISNRNFIDVNSPSLSELVKHQVGDKIVGGTTIYSLRASGGSENSAGNRLSATSDFDLSQITDLGNSILGGDESFPNGPDLLTIAIKPVDTNEINASTPLSISSRLTWTESQA